MIPILSGNVASALPTGYNVANSCRFNKADAPALKRNSMGTATNRKKWTLSMWVKRSTTAQAMLASFDGAKSYFQFQSGGQLEVNDVPGSSFNYRLVTNAVYRDVSAWYHIVVAYDSTQGTDSNRLKLYVNGEQPSLGTATYPSSDFEPEVNSTGSHKYGSYDDSTDYAFDGYFAEIVFIDGTQYAASDFGEFDEDSPRIWKPKKVSGLTFGTNGHYLDFEDSSNLGNDANGGTDFDENNIAAIDQATDTPTNNFATLNPLFTPTSSTCSDGNLTLDDPASGWSWKPSTICPSKGKWYFEVKSGHGSDPIYVVVGVTPFQSWKDMEDEVIGAGANSEAESVGYDKSGNVNKGNSTQYSGTSYGYNDIACCAVDLDNRKIYFRKNDGSWENSGDPTSGATGTGAVSLSTTINDWALAVSSTQKAHINFGGCSNFTISSGNADGNGYGNFEYAPPSGYLALCTKNLGSDGG
jgi:hypothetical protein